MTQRRARRRRRFAGKTPVVHMGLGFNLGWERQKLRDDAKRADATEAKPAPAFRSRAPSFRREELRRERATEAEPAPLLLERFFMAPVAATPKE